MTKAMVMQGGTLDVKAVCREYFKSLEKGEYTALAHYILQGYSNHSKRQYFDGEEISYGNTSREYFLNREDREDILQEVYETLHLNRNKNIRHIIRYCISHHVTPKDSVKHFFTNMTHWKAKDYIKGKKTRTLHHEQQAQRHTSHPEGFEVSIDLKVSIQQTLGREEYSIYQRRMEGYTQKEIVNFLHMYPCTHEQKQIPRSPWYQQRVARELHNMRETLRPILEGHV